MNFGEAIESLKKGKMVTRNGWNGKGMYLWYMPPAKVKAEWCKEPNLKALAEKNGGEIECMGSVRMKTADNKVVTGWVASQADMFAEDWMIYNENDLGFELPKDDWNYKGYRIFRANVDSCGWEDATVNGEEDDYMNPRIPCFNKETKTWDIFIDIKTGQILNWVKGNTASVYYKVVDSGEYSLYDNQMNEYVTMWGYVPKLMDFDDSDGNYGYGDYLGLDIDEDGFIKNWPDNNEIEFFIDDFLSTGERD